MKRLSIEAEPYRWPFDGAVSPGRIAFVIIDMQVDFCGPGGYVDAMGYDIGLTRAAIEPIRAVLDLARREPAMRVIHTREGHRPELVDLPANKAWRSRKVCPGIGEMGPAGRILVRGERGWDIIPGFYPMPGEGVVDKPGKVTSYA